MYIVLHQPYRGILCKSDWQWSSFPCRSSVWLIDPKFSFHNSVLLTLWAITFVKIEGSKITWHPRNIHPSSISFCCPPENHRLHQILPEFQNFSVSPSIFGNISISIHTSELVYPKHSDRKDTLQHLTGCRCCITLGDIVNTLFLVMIISIVGTQLLAATVSFNFSWAIMIFPKWISPSATSS